MIEHKGYIAEVAYDDIFDELHARVANSGPYPVANAVATDVASLKREFALSVDIYLDVCAEHGIEPVKPEPMPVTSEASG